MLASSGVAWFWVGYFGITKGRWQSGRRRFEHGSCFCSESATFAQSLINVKRARVVMLSWQLSSNAKRPRNILLTVDQLLVNVLLGAKGRKTPRNQEFLFAKTGSTPPLGLCRANGRGGLGSPPLAIPAEPLKSRPWVTVTASQIMPALQALSSSLNAGAAKGGCLGRGEAFGCPPAVCPPERPRPFTECRD